MTLAESYHQRGKVLTEQTDIIQESFRYHKTVLFFHGNAASRAVGFRSLLLTLWSTKLDANILAIDYRGFGDSEGIPSEAGLAIDARAAWDYVTGLGARPSDVLIAGTSLGTGVVSKLAHELSQEGNISLLSYVSAVPLTSCSTGIAPRGALLASGFTSIAKLLETYNIFGLLPLFQPLRLIPFVFGRFTSHIRER